MTEKFVSERNLKFLLYDVFDAESLLQYSYFAEHSREMFDMIIDTAMKIGKDKLRPYLEEMDKNVPEFVNGEVKVHPVVSRFMQEAGDGGWISALAPIARGGQQLPSLVGSIANYIFAAANFSMSVYPGLTSGAAHLIESFGSDELKDLFIPKMFAGKWQGTMALTEPQAGSSLADITTNAEPADGSYYKIKGQKIFISAGDHDGVENIIHLLLAKIQGAPPGVKGISLFVIPKKRVNGNGELVSNDVSVAGIYHKLGYRGCPITQLSFGENDDCRGYLVGEPHKGIPYMFQMMNEARINVGFCANATASAAYYAALEYVKDRPQGRKLTEKNPSVPQVPIIEHSDVKRMLLFQRAVVEGSLSLLCQCNKYNDFITVLSGDEKEKYKLLLDLLTPVAKSYPSEMGSLSVSNALQCLGGYGYCDEFPLELYYRDMRIHPIHEGTTGIQGITLLGRNIMMKNGKAFQLFIEEVQKTIQQAEIFDELNCYAQEMTNALQKLQEVSTHLINVAIEGKTEVFLSDATLYLELFGIISIAWQWLVQAIAVQNAIGKVHGVLDAHFYKGKMYTFRYFFSYELPKIEGLCRRLLNTDGLTVDMNVEFFSD
ncbi:MAG: acyl-CoA dehydrogenase [Deltaproteobacteria bacterium]|nr:acyl-CoA dehydrogenase [Deltaproteobacteria bacterium]